MLPHHKVGAINRTIARIGTLGNDIERRRFRGRSVEEIRARVDFYRDRTFACFDLIDIRITSMRMQEDGNPFCEFVFKCLQCGNDKLSFPHDFAPAGAVICAGCNQHVSAYGDVEDALKFLAYDEFHHGEPDKYLQQGASHERPSRDRAARQVEPDAVQVDMAHIPIRP